MMMLRLRKCAALLGVGLLWLPTPLTAASPAEKHPLVTLSIGVDGRKLGNTKIVFDESRLPSYEIGYDAAFFYSDMAQFQIYTCDDQGACYSRNVRPLGDGAIPLGIIFKEEGEAEISASQLDYHVTLIDKALEEEHDLSMGPYWFYSLDGTYNNRFEIRVSRPVSSGDVDDNGSTDQDDLAAIVSYLTGALPAAFNVVEADVNGDGRVSVADVVSLIDMIALQLQLH